MMNMHKDVPVNNGFGSRKKKTQTQIFSQMESISMRIASAYCYFFVFEAVKQNRALWEHQDTIRPRDRWARSHNVNDAQNLQLIWVVSFKTFNDHFTEK